ncbi:HAD-IA family hydrolase [Allokutzneria sp. A3M-2-11 16]|uniref:HAD-IA family hydrolase n=1 Tax=Allokutzneria sp. A3M-2-11 16 TaxID=2962043 RepID=UPI0020B81BF3|nr:HAD-IA family hydrolase [Allokutzneria sp. A3M-2-11 16]MCP3800533.1 HAD-IA family hydrolase [Allokutzneria sp. A3M-2-11 16]
MQLAGLVVDYGGVLTDWGPEPGDEPPLLDVLRQARKHGLRTALLSNADGPGPAPDSAFGMLFDVMVLSGEVGVAKPDERIYQLVADKLGLATADCVFVDDLAGNVRGAVAAGMVGVHHTSVSATITELEALFETKLA